MLYKKYFVDWIKHAFTSMKYWHFNQSLMKMTKYLISHVWHLCAWFEQISFDWKNLFLMCKTKLESFWDDEKNPKHISHSPVASKICTSASSIPRNKDVTASYSGLELCQHTCCLRNRTARECTRYIFMRTGRCLWRYHTHYGNVLTTSRRDVL